MQATESPYLPGVLEDPRFTDGRHRFSCSCDECERIIAKEGSLPICGTLRDGYLKWLATKSQDATRVIQSVALEPAYG
jgi:hypothetical protein